MLVGIYIYISCEQYYLRVRTCTTDKPHSSAGSLRVICPDKGRRYPKPACPQAECYQPGSKRVFSRTPIACPHLASGTESNSLSKKDEVNTGSLPWVNGTKNEGQDFYYGPAPYQTQNSHLSVTWLTCYPSEQVFNYEWHVWTKEHYIFEVQLCSHFFLSFFLRGVVENNTDAVVQVKADRCLKGGDVCPTLSEQISLKKVACFIFIFLWSGCSFLGPQSLHLSL